MSKLLFMNLPNIQNVRRIFHLQLINDAIDYGFGRIESIRVPNLREGQTVRHAYVTYEERHIGHTVKRQYNGYIWRGRQIDVEIKDDEPTYSQYTNTNQQSSSIAQTEFTDTYVSHSQIEDPRTNDPQITFIVNTQLTGYSDGTSKIETRIIYQREPAPTNNIIDTNKPTNSTMRDILTSRDVRFAWKR